MTRLWTASSHVSPSLRKIEWITFSTDLSAQEERIGDRRVVLPLGHRAQHVALARGQLAERRLLARGHSPPPTPRRPSGSITEPPSCDGANRGHQLLEILHALLEEVGTPRAAALQEREHVARVRVLAEHDDADLRVRLAQPLGGLNPLVGVARRHADVGDDDVRRSASTAASSESRSPQTAATSRSGSRLEQPPDALTDEVVVLGEHEPDRHGRGYAGDVSGSRRIRVRRSS